MAGVFQWFDPTEESFICIRGALSERAIQIFIFESL